MTKKPPTSKSLGIEAVTHRHKSILLVPRGGFKNTRERTVSISLPRVRCLEDGPDVPPKSNRRR